MMDPDLDEMDFSFSCNKCSFTTKDMVEIKKHMFGHKNHGKDLSQKVAEAGSSQTGKKKTSLNNNNLFHFCKITPKEKLTWYK